jgi:hypothetical protein
MLEDRAGRKVEGEQDASKRNMACERCKRHSLSSARMNVLFVERRGWREERVGGRARMNREAKGGRG